MIKFVMAGFIVLTQLFPVVSNASGEDLRWRFSVEAGPVWQSRNDVQIPGDTGTRFSLADLAGEGPLPFIRLELVYDINTRHSLRFLLAPFEYSETGVLSRIKGDLFKRAKKVGSLSFISTLTSCSMYIQCIYDRFRMGLIESNFKQKETWCYF